LCRDGLRQRDAQGDVARVLDAGLEIGLIAPGSAPGAGDGSGIISPSLTSLSCVDDFYPSDPNDLDFVRSYLSIYNCIWETAEKDPARALKETPALGILEDEKDAVSHRGEKI
jgi:hypothetical protein